MPNKVRHYQDSELVSKPWQLSRESSPFDRANVSQSETFCQYHTDGNVLQLETVATALVGRRAYGKALQ